MKQPSSVKDFLDGKVRLYNRREFIEQDPIFIPHQFSGKQDREISGFWIAMLAWGQRKTIINKGMQLLELMDHSPYEFVLNCKDHELRPLEKFVHRTFQGTDGLYFMDFFRRYYRNHRSLEEAFINSDEVNRIKNSLTRFHRLFFDTEYAPSRTRKHVATPARNSACKRLNMFLRWMVRRDEQGVDFGIWHKLDPKDLICPCDVHVIRVANQLGLIQRKQSDWKTAELLTQKLRQFDPADPVKYDFALFGLGVMENY